VYKVTDRYAVFGNPIAHSKSPWIHQQFADQTQQDLLYEKQLVATEAFASTAQAFFNDGGKGLNITVPFKLEAYELADQLSQRARQAGAVNTLWCDASGRIQGDNTDGVGIVTDISANLGWQIAGKKVLILGAGGAVRGVLGPLLLKNPAVVVIANRTAEKAKQLATAFSRQGELLGCGYDAVPETPYDLIINGTSASLAGELPPLCHALVAKQTNCYDMMYGAEDTVFMRWAQGHGAGSVSDGLGMLVEQAAESFFIWRAVRPETMPVIQAIRELL
jgi:shikimate dehydrogenase